MRLSGFNKIGVYSVVYGLLLSLIIGTTSCFSNERQTPTQHVKNDIVADDVIKHSPPTHNQLEKVEMVSANSIEITIDGLVCDFCARGLEHVLRDKKRIDRIDIDMDASMMRVILEKDEQLEDTEIQKIVEDNGFTLRRIVRPGSTKKNVIKK